MDVPKTDWKRVVGVAVTALLMFYFCMIVVVGDIAVVTVAGSSRYSTKDLTCTKAFRQPHLQIQRRTKTHKRHRQLVTVGDELA
jgi:hypothetical protein